MDIFLPPLPLEVMPTKEGVLDFTYAEESKTLFYRDDKKNIHKMTVDFDDVLASSSLPLARVIDVKGRFLLNEGIGRILGTIDPKPDWKSFAKAPLQHLYWHNDKLYSLEIQNDTSPRWRTYVVHEYRPGAPKSKAICTFHQRRSLDLSLAQGSIFPSLWLKSSRKKLQGYFLSLYRFNISQCRLETAYQLPDPFKGPIEEVYQFEKSRATAIVIDHPTHHFMMQSSGSCRYLDLENQAPVILNYDKPVIATWSYRDGLALVFPLAGEKSKIAEKLKIEELSSRTLWLSPLSHDLFLAPQLKGEKTRQILKVHLDS